MPEVKISLTGVGKNRRVILMYSFGEIPKNDPSKYTLKQIDEKHYGLTFDNNLFPLKPQKLNGKIWYQRGGQHLLSMFSQLENFGKTKMIEKNTYYSLPESVNDPRLFLKTPDTKYSKLPDQIGSNFPLIIYPAPIQINTTKVKNAIDGINNLVDESNGDLELSIENGKLTAALITKIT